MRITPIFVLLLILAACGPENTRVAQPSDPQARIDRLLEMGEFQQAAAETLNLAQLYPNQADDYQLKAAEIYMQSGDVISARAVLEDMDSQGIGANPRYNLLSAEIALRTNSPENALNTLNNIRTTSALSEQQLARYYRARIAAYKQQGDYLAAVKEQIKLATYLSDEPSKSANTRDTWATINNLETETFKQQRRTAEPVLASWLELASIYQGNFFNPRILEQSVMMWREQYPAHPANGIITDDILLGTQTAALRPGHVALLLPFSLYGRESAAIRDGFLAAWYASSTYRPRLSIYDYDILTVNTVYARAVAAGADFIVGPLEKKAIENLVEGGEIRVPTLALNQVDNPVVRELPEPASGLPALVQFGLTPEDEARQAALRAAQDGHSRALVIAPNNSWGQRLVDAFEDTWQHGDGKIVESIRYPENASEYKTWVKSLLNVNTSEQRSNVLRSRLNRATLKSESRLRADADMIFMPALPVSARRIVPEFRFFQTDIPVYSTSEIYNGIINPQLDKDMDGVLFMHMPWILEPATGQSDVQGQVNRNWQADRSGYRRFYAFGVDAFQLIPNLGRMALQNSVFYPGETGHLSLTPDKRIQRELLWARFVDGVPLVID